MIEKQSINGRDVWLEVEPYRPKRDNANVIPTEYFVARYYLQDPISQSGNLLRGEDGNPLFFESPVAALTYASKELRSIV
jgi:hypothetical protein